MTRALTDPSLQLSRFFFLEFIHKSARPRGATPSLKMTLTHRLVRGGRFGSSFFPYESASIGCNSATS